MAQLFGDERRTAAILEFLATTTEVGVERTTEDGSCGSGGSRGRRVAEAGRGRDGRGRGRIRERGQGGDGRGRRTVPRRGRGVEARDMM
jgi:hypothetical protein